MVLMLNFDLFENHDIIYMPIILLAQMVNNFGVLENACTEKSSVYWITALLKILVLENASTAVLPMAKIFIVQIVVRDSRLIWDIYIL